MKKVSTTCVINIMMLTLIIVASLYLKNKLYEETYVEYDDNLVSQLSDDELLDKLKSSLSEEKNIQKEIIKNETRDDLFGEVNCEKCNDTNRLRWEKIMNEESGGKEIDVIFGEPTQWNASANNTWKNNQENAPPNGMGENSLFLFKNNESTPGCCESGKAMPYSSSTGCVCRNKEQLKEIFGNVLPPYESSLKFKPFNKIINDE